MKSKFMQTNYSLKLLFMLHFNCVYVVEGLRYVDPLLCPFIFSLWVMHKAIFCKLLCFKIWSNRCMKSCNVSSWACCLPICCIVNVLVCKKKIKKQYQQSCGFHANLYPFNYHEEPLLLSPSHKDVAFPLGRVYPCNCSIPTASET